MATRRQREAAAAAPRPVANAGLRNQTAAAAARSGPRNRTAAAPVAVAVAAPSGPRNQTATAAARSGPRNRTATAAATVAAPSRLRNQTAACTAAPTCRPHARNRRPLGEIGNHVNTPVADREANNRCRLSSRPNIDTVAPARARPAATEDANTSRITTVSGENKKPSKGATTLVTRTRSKTDTTVDSFMKRLATAEAKAARATEQLERTGSQIEVLRDSHFKLNHNHVKVVQDYKRDLQATIEVMETNSKLKAMVDKKESELQKVMELNLRLLCDVDKKEAQLQAMIEQCKALALNSN